MKKGSFVKKKKKKVFSWFISFGIIFGLIMLLILCMPKAGEEFFVREKSICTKTLKTLRKTKRII